MFFYKQAIEDRDIFNKKKVVQATFTSEPSDLESTEPEDNNGVKFVIGSKSSFGSHRKFSSMQENDKHSTSGSDTQITNEVVPTDDDLYLTDTRTIDANNPIMAAIARLAAGHSSDSTDEVNKPITGFTGEYNGESSVQNSFTKHNGFASTNSPSGSTFGAAMSVNAEISSQNDSVTKLHETNQDDEAKLILPSITSHTLDKLTENNVSLLSKDDELTPSIRSQHDALSTKAFSDLNTSATVKTKTSLDNTQTISPRSPILGRFIMFNIKCLSC